MMNFSFVYPSPYNKRFQHKFRTAFNMNPLEEEPTKVGDQIPNNEYFYSFYRSFKENLEPLVNKSFLRAHRCGTVFEGIVLPSLIAFGLIYWPYNLSFKLITLMSSTILYTRFRNKIQEPEAPETYIREMLHTHSKLGELFKVDTTSTLDFNIKYDGMPSREEFPEFNNKIYRLMNNDGNFISGEYTFGDVESNAMVRIKFKTMPIRRKYKYVLGEPTFLYDVTAELNHNGVHEELVLVDRKKTLKQHRPYLIF